MRAFAAGLVLVLLSGETATAGKLDVAYASMERLIVSKFLTEGGRRYLNAFHDVVVTRVLQTAAGRIIFAQPKGG